MTKSKLHCPKCGAEIEKGKVAFQDRISTCYETKCSECNTSILIEDRSSFEQEEIVEIILK